MAKLPDNPHTTLAHIEATVRQRAEDWRRPHLGASIIGRSCERQIWYAFRWAKAPEHSGRMLRLFQRGHREEDVFVELLRLIGVEVHTVDPATGRQFSVSAHGDHFGGSMDGAAVGLVEAPRRWHLLEFKTSGDKAFAELVKLGVEQAKPEHYAQMQVYMHLAGLERAYYMAVNKNNDAIHAERVHYHRQTAERLLERAERIIYAQTPPPRLSDDPEWYECQFCDYRTICHDRMPPSHVSCRTCLHATPERDGRRRWSCAYWQADIPLSAQKKGCDEHRLIPALVAYAEPVDASEADNWVLYRTEGGFEFRNGPRGDQSFSSSELAHLPPGLIGDQQVDALRQQFGAEIVESQEVA